jgi:hypothetical protein
MAMRRRIWFLLLIPAVAITVATLLSFSQGGFGGGHGDFDLAIGVLGLPGILLIEHMPFLHHLPDILLVVIVPALLNFIFWFAIIIALGAVRRGKSTI